MGARHNGVTDSSGEVYSYDLSSNNYVLFRVIGFHEDKGGSGPVCEILDWSNFEVPNRRKIRKLNYRSAKKPFQHLSQFLMVSLGPKDFKEDRGELVANHIKPKQPTPKCAGATPITSDQLRISFVSIYLTV